MGVISCSYLKKHCNLIIENSKQALLKLEEGSGLNRTYYYVVIKSGNKYTHPYRLRMSEYQSFYNKIKYNKQNGTD